MADRWGEKCKQWQALFSWAPKSPWTVTAATKLKGTCSLGKKHKPRQCIQKQKHHFVNKDLYSQSYGFSSSHVGIWELDHEEGWVPNNWCFQTVVLEKTLESLLDSKEIKLVNPKGNQPWIFIGRTDAEAESPILSHRMLTLWKRPWCWGRLEAKGEEGGWGWEG